MPVLNLLKGRSTRVYIVLGEEELILGRDEDCDIRVESEYVSQRHCKFMCVEGEHFIVDLKSRNKTLVNGKVLAEQVSYRLKDHDLIRICDCTYVFHEDSSEIKKPGHGSKNRVPVELIDSLDEDDESSVSSPMESSSSKWELSSARNTELKLRAMMQLTRQLHDAVSLDDMLTKLLDRLLRIFRQAGSAIALIREEGDDDARLTVVRHRQMESPQEDSSIRKPIVDRVWTGHHGIVTDSSHESIICAPMVDVDDRSLGVIYLSSETQDKKFTGDDLDLLNHIALQTSFAVETIKLHEALRRDHERRLELETAQRIQLALLPSECPRIAGYDFADFYNPAREVGGDYYDYIRLRDGRCAIVIGDVSGKGVPAALVVASLSSLVKAYLANDAELVDVMHRINIDFLERIAKERFMTLALMVLDPVNHQLTIVNAGHQPPLLRRQDRSVVNVGDEAAGLPLGVIREPTYRQCQVDLQPGDSLVLYTDGITEATDSAGRMYGLGRLRLQLAGETTGAGRLRSQIIDDVLDFVGKFPQWDDMCLLCIRRDEAS